MNIIVCFQENCLETYFLDNNQYIYFFNFINFGKTNMLTCYWKKIVKKKND